ncbi:MAG: hypothetical protein VX899_14630 [Myxococcota bacterium]|nr:hypothetical protein [Myxococcota bacterium]
MVLLLSLACNELDTCAFDTTELGQAQWAGQSAEQWAAPYVGSWVVEPAWMDQELRPATGVAESFQLDLARSGEPVVVWEHVSGSLCDPRDKIRIPLSGSIQSLDGSIQAVHSGAEESWYLEVSEDGDAKLSILAETETGSLAWNDTLFEGDPEQGHNWRFFVSATEQEGSFALDHVERTPERNSASSVWGEGLWAW